MRSERGQTSLLIVGFFLVGILMVAVVVDASAAYLRRQQLDTVADGAALAGAAGVRGEQVYEGGLAERAAIDPAVAAAHVAEHLRSTGALRRFPGLTYRVDAAADAVTVRVSAPLDLPLRPPGWSGSATVSSVAAAYVAVTP